MARSGSATASKDVDVSKLRIVSVEDILSAEDIKTEVVPVPEWGGAVRVKSFTKREEQAIRAEAGASLGADGSVDMDNDLFELLLFVHGVVEPKFEVAQVELLRDKSSVPIDRVLKTLMDISGMTEEARQRAKTTFPPTT